ncbi:hypothetical protein CBR_g52240 [Chara braunii]|uniref:Uncharacterized protein n=1 Tax=Chara braunii TaxID=69332 RepID=A0A388MA38_CHABU|nr:hypothetical protein CBR_g52240 [Chara braunii]|eukprot:GBG91353.1 hypothetical protein CBR_g52240 [Chara braunii]
MAAPMHQSHIPLAPTQLPEATRHLPRESPKSKHAKSKVRASAVAVVPVKQEPQQTVIPRAPPMSRACQPQEDTDQTHSSKATLLRYDAKPKPQLPPKPRQPHQQQQQQQQQQQGYTPDLALSESQKEARAGVQPHLYPHVQLKSGAPPALKQELQQEPKKRPQGGPHLPVGSSTPWQPRMQVRGHPASSSTVHCHSPSQAQQQPAQPLPVTGSNPGVHSTASRPGSQPGSQPAESQPAGSQPAGSQATGSPSRSQPGSQSGPQYGLQPASQPGSQAGAQTAQVGSQPASGQIPSANNSTPGNAAAAAAAAETPPERGGQKISCDDIQLVQNLIERCLQLYLNQREVITSLQYHAKIGPDFTSLVWQKLEEQNPEFFKAYYVRLKLKEQIHTFNNLLACQVHKMDQMQLSYKQAMPQGNALAPATGIPTNGVRAHGPIAPIGYPANPMQTGIGTPHRLLPMAPATGQPVVNGTPVPGAYVGPAQASPAANPMMDIMIGLTPPMGAAATGIPAVSSDVTLGSMGPTPAPPMSMPTVQGFPFGNIGPAPGSDMVGIGLGTALPLEHAYEASLTASDTSTPSAMNSLSLTMPEAESQKESLSSLGALPRNFSLSDLAGELNNNMGLDGGLLASLSDSSPLLSPNSDDFLRSPDKDDLDDDHLLDFD